MIIAFAAALVASAPAAVAPPAAAAEKKVPAHRASAHQRDLFGIADYPPAAEQAGEQGTVAYRMVIGTDGRVKDCTIVKSSGSALLDETTCRLLTERARFKPARDEAGKRVEDEYGGRMNWVLPGN